MVDSNKFKIGDISISLEGETEDIDFSIPPAYLPFVADNDIRSDISLQLHHGKPSSSLNLKVFESPPIWSLYRDNGSSALKLFEHMPGYGRTLVLHRNIETADLYFNNHSDLYTDPFYGPTLELLMVNYLAQGRGIIIHGCGIRQGDRGVIFVGESGAGKTTTANIWHQESGAEVLSDDRTLVRKQGDQFVMYGTPWHGEGKFGSPGRVRLDQIFFIQHGAENSILKSSNAHSVTQFLKCSFPPLWDAAGMEYSMDIFSDLAATVPCYELSFKPDSSIVDFINSNRTED